MMMTTEHLSGEHLTQDHLTHEHLTQAPVEWGVVIESDLTTSREVLGRVLALEGSPAVSGMRPTYTIRDGVLRLRFRLSAQDADAARQTADRLLGPIARHGVRVSEIISLDD